MRQRRASRAPLTVSVLLFSSRLAATHSFFFFLVQVYVSFFLSHFFFYRTWVDTDTVPCTPLHQIIYCCAKLSRFSLDSRENAFSVSLQCAWMKDDEGRRRGTFKFFMLATIRSSSVLHLLPGSRAFFAWMNHCRWSIIFPLAAAVL